MTPGSLDGDDVRLAPGTLYLVATPIGNLGDLSARALAVLVAVDWIAAEDTRHTGRLLAHFGVKRPMLSVPAPREASRVTEIVARLARGTTGALVVDAGSPAISDPGARLVRATIDAGFEARVVPGPSAVIAALTVSGLDPSAFTFAGFLPARVGARDARLEALLARPETVVLFEAPHRARATLDALARLAPDRPMAACRELTKRHEEVLRGTPAVVRAQVTDEKERGEWALVIAGAPKAARAPRVARAPAGRGKARRAAPSPPAGDPRERFIAAQVAAGASPGEAARRADFVLGPPKGKRP